MVNVTTEQLKELVTAAVQATLEATQGNTTCSRAGSSSDHESSWRWIHKRFMAGRPPAFSGNGSITEALGWLQEIEKHLRILKCSPEYKQQLATFQLTNMALDWWNTASAGLDPDAIPFEDFRKKFLDKYVPSAKQEQLRQQFMVLRQGNHSVEEYEKYFARLATFAPSEVDTEQKRIERIDRFAYGRVSWIGGSIYGNQSFQSYNETVNAALKLEHFKNEHRHDSSKQQQGSSESKPQQSGGQKVKPDGNKSYFNKTVDEREWNPGQETQGEAKRPNFFEGPCFNCGERGHPARECPKPKERRPREQTQGEARRLSNFEGPCFNCGKRGHLARECPKPKEERLREQAQGQRPHDQQRQGYPPARAFGAIQEE